MRIKQIHIENFRSIKKSTIDCVRFSSFVGPNGAGKSTVLNALNLFFGEISNFSEEDFHQRDDSLPIVVKITFHELSDEAIEEFSHYVRSGLLVVQAEVAKEPDGTFKKTVRGERLVFPPFKSFFETSGASPRKQVFDKLREDHPGIESATNDGAREAALLTYEEALPDEEKELTPSGAEFFGVSKGAHKFQRHVSWVYIPAVKEAATESEEGKSSHLGKLIQHTIRSQMDYDAELERIRKEAFKAYSGLLDSQRKHLEGLESRLADRLQSAVMTDAGLELAWKQDEKSISVDAPTAQVMLSERGYSDRVEKFGHGLQRSFLLVILQELMAVDSTVSPTLILGCEEPELYQHPPQARHLAEILMELSEADAQVFVTTHSPYFIDVDYFDGIKMFRNDSGSVEISKSSFECVLKEYNKAFNKKLQNEDQARTKLAIQIQPKFNEIFFAERVVLVEGISDLACIEAYLRLSDKKRDFQKSGSFIVVCEGKSSLALMLLVAKSFGIQHHVIFDCDAVYKSLLEKDAAKYKRAHDEHIRDNDAILALTGHEKMESFPDSHIIKDNLTAWHFDIERMLEEEFGAKKENYYQAGRDAVGNLGGTKKHPLFVAACMSAAWDDGVRFETLGSLIDRVLA
ncbi:ATP-dependent nuclease [Histidinibacterium aquaticum]|uniref:AAA family ATPase n=1 Tax=Histidinibacterium aquaticum TaxID=2613962 RepID=A0A5J5GHR7_9RHOB|nr:ATP-dependent endonuclease [Histidinibacterium aquaticum]KAA9007776.1 AAA family ATPase [Histidinibacterium aquaticum]